MTQTVNTPPRDPADRPVVIFNNIVTPYTNRLYARLAERVNLAIVSAAGTEANRAWGDVGAAPYHHEVLPGFRLQLGPGRFAYLNTGIFRTLSRLRPRLLLINGFYPSMLLATLWAMLTRTPLALTIDGWAETMPNSPYHRLIRPLILSACRFVVVPGNKGRDYFRSQGFADSRIVTVPLVPAWDGPATVTPFAERRFDLLWCGHLNHDAKNVGFLVELCRCLKPLRPDLTLRIIGDGPAREETLAALRALGIDPVYDPARRWDEMAGIFSASRLLVFPSVWEPWGLVCNEALQCGTPALVSPHVGAGDDLIRGGETGYVLPLDAEQWAATAQRLLADPSQWQALSDAGRAEMSTRTLDASVQTLAKALAA